jgi:hypothetical protein
MELVAAQYWALADVDYQQVSTGNQKTPIESFDKSNHYFDLAFRNPFRSFVSLIGIR